MSAKRSDARPDSSSSWDEPPGLARALVTGCCIAGPVVFAASAVGVHACGESWPRAILFSLFITFWGGLGFGCMFGAVVWATRLEAATATAPGAVEPTPVTPVGQGARAAGRTATRALTAPMS